MILTNAQLGGTLPTVPAGKGYLIGNLNPAGGPAGFVPLQDVAPANTKLYQVSFSFVGGVLANSQKLGYHRFSLGVTFPPDFGNNLAYASQAGGDANATSSTVVTVYKAASASPTSFSSVGTITFAGGGVTPTFSTSGSAVTFAQGDVLKLQGPSTADATFADFYCTLVGYRS